MKRLNVRQHSVPGCRPAAHNCERGRFCWVRGAVSAVLWGDKHRPACNRDELDSERDENSSFSSSFQCVRLLLILSNVWVVTGVKMIQKLNKKMWHKV